MRICQETPDEQSRLEAFSDGVIAIMVLELEVPHEPELAALLSLAPVFLSYLLSFVFVGIYWNNHHHMLHAAQQVSGSILWANMHLLFWLSLVPFTAAWMGENGRATDTVALYSGVMLMAGVAYYILARALALAIGKDRKGLISLLIYALAIPIAFASAWLAFAMYVVVALIWFIPDRRIERVLT